MRVTMADVATSAGVSPTTVSFVLSGRPGAAISEQTAARVRSTAAELGYRHNAAARALALSRTHLIGVVTDVVSSPFAGDAVLGAQSRAWGSGLQVLIASVEHQPILDPAPFEVLMGNNKVVFMYWYSYFRLVPFTPGLKHSDDPDPSFFGEEIGRWEGDTLVIDSIGFKDEKVWIDENANPHSDALHVVERWTRPDYNHIHVETLIEDKKFYTRPFTYSRTWALGEPDEQIQEYSCSENNVDAAHLGFGPGPIRPDGTRGYVDPAPLPPPVPRK